MKRGQKRGEKPEWFGFASERWQAGMSTTLILDAIVDQFGADVEYSTFSRIRQNNPEAFPVRETATRKAPSRMNS